MSVRILVVVAVGIVALDAVTTGDSNVALGYDALTALTTASNTIAIGYGAGKTITTGDTKGLYIGFNAGTAVTSGTDNVLTFRRTTIGHESKQAKCRCKCC